MSDAIREPGLRHARGWHRSSRASAVCRALCEWTACGLLNFVKVRENCIK